MATTPPTPEELLRARVRHDFTNHPSEDEHVANVLDQLTKSAIAFGDVLIDHCPEGRELSMALTDLEGCLHHAKAAVARNQSAVHRP